MDEGVIVADGKTQEILEDTKLLEAHGLEEPHETNFCCNQIVTSIGLHFINTATYNLTIEFV